MLDSRLAAINVEKRENDFVHLKDGEILRTLYIIKLFCKIILQICLVVVGVFNFQPAKTAKL